MKKLNEIYSFLILILIITSCQNGNNNQTQNEDTLTTVISVDPFAYDSVYAEQLGADEYGMKPYVMAFLKEGPNRDLDSAEAVELQKGHMENINRMAEEGKLVLAGPFYNNPESDLRGIYIFNVATIEEAEELTNTDPAIQAGSLIMELMPWYGSAALMEVNNIHKKVAKENI